MKFPEEIFAFFIDNTKKISHKAAIIIVVLSTLLIIDDTLGLSYTYKQNNRIDLLKKANEIIENSKVDTTLKSYANGMLEDMISRKTVWGSIKSFKINLFKNCQENQKSKPQYKMIESSVIIILFAMVFLPFIFLLFRYEEKQFIEGLALAIVNGLGWIIIAFVTYELLDLLPMIGKNWDINIGLNWFLQVPIVLFIKWYFSRNSIQIKKNVVNTVDEIPK
jgi:hypothetical protein